MLQSLLLGLDGSAYNAAALALGIRWAQHCGAVLVGMGVVDEPTICHPEPVPLGGSAYKHERDAQRMAPGTPESRGVCGAFYDGVCCGAYCLDGRPRRRTAS